jgi:N-acetylglutamate synthase/N-acetylornithine aminotransferase
MLLVAACQSYVQQQEVQHKVDVEQDHLRLMVYTSDLTEPYEKLGDLSYSDPLNGETIDTDHINEKLRQMAIERWGQQVDAIILVTTKVGGTDTSTISVTGEAVRIQGACAGCRHNYSEPPG